MNDRIVQEIKELKYAYQFERRPLKCTFPPSFIYVEPTNACNLKCKMCMRDKIEIREKGFMDFDLYKKVIDNIAHKVPSIGLFAQGEPLLHPKSIDMIKYAKQKGLKVGFNTNAVLLNETKSKEILKTDLDWIYFSFDGPNKEVYEEIRRGANYEKTKENILRFIELRNKKKIKKPLIKLDIIEMSDTKPFLDEFRIYWEDKVDKVGLEKLINFFDLIDDDELDWYKNIKKQDYPLSNYPVCLCPWHLMVINWDGGVSLCMLDFAGYHVVGDAAKENVLDIWNNDRAIEFRKALIERDFSKVYCANCSSLWSPKDQVCPTLKGYIFSRLLYLQKTVKFKRYSELNYYWYRKWEKHFEWNPRSKKWKFKI